MGRCPTAKATIEWAHHVGDFTREEQERSNGQHNQEMKQRHRALPLRGAPTLAQCWPTSFCPLSELRPDKGFIRKLGDIDASA
ncbi:MAG TPA: hypothetical protein VNO32_27620 [Candidatus Acidoferrum sp.]|nr:hypothetical protein [Candidatus Acidoferrum sp.]